ncbi:MAG: hypothetical protein FJ280_07055 [Planctomycetes bacterium]|nr:hypothetical protein [Deltaproteobacteria bacterium]MBM4025155.1 hypothetical protein [Planctomycetota bacterium]
MERLLGFTIGCLVTLISAGCVNTRSIPYETHARPAKSPDFPIEIRDEADISRPYKIIGVVEANAGRLHSPTDTINNLKRQARAMGADALIGLQRGAGAGMITPVGSSYVYGNMREIWSAKAIVWNDEHSQLTPSGDVVKAAPEE